MKYIEVVEIIRQAVTKLKPFEKFYIGTEWEQTQLKDHSYPSVFFELNSFVTIVPGSKTYQMAFYVLDRIIPNSAGETETNKRVLKVLTKTEELTHNIFALIYKEHKTLHIQDNYTLLPVVEYLNEQAYGHRVEFTVKLPFANSYCELPITDSDFENIYEC